MYVTTLNHYEYNMSGSYIKDQGDIMYLLDTSKEALTIKLPDLLACGSHVFYFKNIGVYNATLNTVNGQVTDDGVQSIVVNPKELVIIVSDGIGKWVKVVSDIIRLSSNWQCIEEAGTGDLVFQKWIAGVWTEKYRFF